MTTTPSVLFVCVKNGGKSQMAAALMRKRAADTGDTVEAHSAGTRPGSAVNALSAEVVAELGADMSGRVPAGINPDVLRRVDRVVVLGDEAAVEFDDDNNAIATTLETWHTDEPSERGIEGPERMRLVRDDIARRVAALLDELTDSSDTKGSPSEPDDA